MNKKGFTLLELLVVVLIIGILAGIALPQYRKAVVKSKLAEVDLALSAAKQNIRLYLDANGWPGEGSMDIFFTGSDSIGSIDLPGDCDTSSYECETELAKYSAECLEDCCWMTVALKFSNHEELFFTIDSDPAVWYLWFLSYDPSKEVCQWIKERNYPALGDAVTSCSELGVTLEEYEAE